MRLLSSLAALLLFPAAASGQATVYMKQKFLEKHCDSATMDIRFKIDKAHKSPNPVGAGSDDGDLHMAGRSSNVGLPMVAEIVNAKPQTQALQFVKDNTGTDQTVALSGVLRLWFEHPPGKDDPEQKQLQKKSPPKPKDTNPPHIFEIHPITRIGDKNLAGQIKFIDGFKADDASTAFGHYESRWLELRHDSQKKVTALRSPKAVYNYAEFFVELQETPKPMEGGVGALAWIYNGEWVRVSTASRIRMVFVNNSPAASVVAGKGQGTRLRVLGVPRIDLARVCAVTKERPDEDLRIRLPYEMIVIGATEIN
jgi:hypothetical protein